MESFKSVKPFSAIFALATSRTFSFVAQTGAAAVKGAVQFTVGDGQQAEGQR